MLQENKDQERKFKQGRVNVNKSIQNVLKIGEQAMKNPEQL